MADLIQNPDPLGLLAEVATNVQRNQKIPQASAYPPSQKDMEYDVVFEEMANLTDVDLLIDPNILEEDYFQ